MQASASEPVLRNEDYNVPSDGVGLTGHAKKILMGPMSKDKGTYSSRINQIVRQAAKVPGPGMYVQHKAWDDGIIDHVIHAGNKFPAGTRDYKPCNKNPAPATYEAKNFALGPSISSSTALTQNPRTTYGQIPKGKKRSFLDQAEAHGKRVPAPGDMIQKRNNKLDTACVKVLSWKLEVGKNGGKRPAEKELGPDHYKPQFEAQEERQANYTIPKAKAQNFLDKAVKEKLVCLRTKKEVPGPGTYNVHDYDDSKFSRGTKFLQLRGMSRSSVSGYF